MLYLTTRNSRDAYTAQRALRENRGPDGGMYLPFRPPVFSAEAWIGPGAVPFGARVSEVLNYLFQKRLSCWDVDVCIGRNPVKLERLGHRIQVAELWHNPGKSYDYLARELSEQLFGESTGAWLTIAVRVAVLFGIFGKLPCDRESVDVSVVSGDFSLPISLWYARQWGLPIGNIICCCNENCGLWELLHQGQMRTDATSVRTILPEADVSLPDQLERLVYEAGGAAEVARYLEVCRRGGSYAPGDIVLKRMNQGLSVSVVSSSRIGQTISSVYRTHNYILPPAAALSYAGLMDYRAKRGQAGNALILADKSPVLDGKLTAGALGITERELLDLL